MRPPGRRRQWHFPSGSAGPPTSVPWPPHLRWSSGGIWWTHRDVGEVPYAAIPTRIIEFFKNEPHLLPPQQDKKLLHDWMVQNGAPKDSEIPASLISLESAACQVVEVKGKNVLLSCYWRETIPGRGPHELIHLVVARSADFFDQPKSATPVVTEADGWSFASWSKGDTIYTLATAAPKGKILPYISAAMKDEGQATAWIGGKCPTVARN